MARLHQNTESPLAAIAREVQDFRNRSIAEVNSSFHEGLSTIAREAKEQREQAAAALSQASEAINLHANLVRTAIDACGTGELETIQALHSFQTEFGGNSWQAFCDQFPLSLAINNLHAHIVQFLLDNHVDYTLGVAACLPAYRLALVFSYSHDEVLSPDQRSIYNAMKDRVLRDMVQASENGNLAWFYNALGRYSLSINAATALINTPIPDKNGLTPMMVLAIDNRLDAIRVIAEGNPARALQIDFTKLDANGKTIFDHAFECGHKELIEWIMGKSGMVLSPLEQACRSGDLTRVNTLLAQRANPAERQCAPLLWATLYGHTNIVTRLLEPNFGLSAEYVGARDNAALVIAVRYGHNQIARALRTAGANPLAQNSLPIRLARAQEQQELAEFLINQPDREGMTSLHWACQTGDLAHLSYCLQNGFNINSRTTIGWTPLHFAYRYDQIAVITALCDAHADRNVRDYQDRIPADYMTLQRRTLLIETLRAAARYRPRRREVQQPIESTEARIAAARLQGEATNEAAPAVVLHAAPPAVLHAAPIASNNTPVTANQTSNNARTRLLFLAQS